MRTCYRCLLWLHPPVFRREYGGEMLWIYDQSADSQGVVFADGLRSLARRWLLRSGWWKIALALAIALFQVVLGGLGALLFGYRKVAEAIPDPTATSIAEFSRHGSIAHQPLTVGIVMYLAVFVVGGLTVMVIGLTFWMRNFARRVR